MKEGLRQRLIDFADRFGYTVVPNWLLDGVPLARHLRKLFQEYKIDCVFDVGANQGQYADYLRKWIRYEGLIVSVEPVKAHVSHLRTKAKADPLWMVFDVALGAAPGRLPMNVMRAGDFSSFLSPDTNRWKDFAEANTVVAVEDVEVTTFDELLSRVQKQHPVRNVYLKLDTQGFDLEVIKGMRSSEGNVRAIQSEMSVIPIYEHMPDYITALQMLQDRGFVLSGMFPVSHILGMKLVEFDCVMVRLTDGSSEKV